MLPNMTPETVAEMEKKGFRTTPQLCQAASDNPNAVKGSLASVLGSPKEASEVMQVHMHHQAHMQCILSLYLMHSRQAVPVATFCQCGWVHNTTLRLLHKSIPFPGVTKSQLGIYRFTL